jgi:hypothetical protein
VRRQPSRIEPPAWYQDFDPAAWDTPDAQEQSMIEGCQGFGEWPPELRRIHAERRWQEAKYRYRQEHPALATQEFEDLVNAERWARKVEKRGW